ncbi:alpha/beta hydrolase [Pusillimonas noertemannii]|uniref:alpha/beta hydrolase n=1 Tax=Pusillimonas noertemannii TaxID=305977 RepID=UPI000A01F9AA|nr:alpha/beta-hydrolase family protein [Pusillimonas noertemannii]
MAITNPVASAGSEHRPRPRSRSWWRPRRLSVAGELTGTLFFAASLTPSLIPRSALMQGVLSGICLAVGYALGVFLSWLWCYLELRSPAARLRRPLHWAVALGCAVVAAYALWSARPWQDALRQIMAMPPTEPLYLPTLLVGALVTFLVLLLAGRLFQRLAQWFMRRARALLPRRVAIIVGVACAMLLFATVINGVLLRFALHVTDDIFRQTDAFIPPDEPAPALDYMTGSQASLIPWENLGRTGRDYIASTPSAADIEAATSRSAQAPIRVYVGLPAAQSAAERAQLALKELQRVGGFSRSALVVITPTGTGWVDPGAIESVEYLYSGDIASVAMQYSYLSSPLSLMIEPDYGEEAARALFNAIYSYWKTLPPESRPKLYLHGLSLGAKNSERSVNAWELLGDPVQGALWSGPPFLATHWRALAAARNAGSPAWLPEFGDGSVVRFMNQFGSPVPAGAPWGPFRIVYLQYASDAITFFNPNDAWREPEWMASPRGPDVLPTLRWYPVISMFQFALDMMLADTTPMGYGHVFAPSHYVDAWLLVTGIANHSPQTLQGLKQLLDARRLQSKHTD